MSKITKLLGVGLVVAVLASLFVATAPASAATLGWSSEGSGASLPAVAGSDITDMAVAGNGTTIFATGGTVDMDLFTAGTQLLVKSTNSGTAWASVALNPPAGAVAATSVTAIAVAPDVTDGSWIAIIVNGNAVWVSTDGGLSWGAPVVPAGLVMKDIAIGPAVLGSRKVAVVGDDTVSAKLWTFDVGGNFPTPWTDTTVTAAGGWDATRFDAQTTAYAVAFSPKYVGDKTIVVVTANATNAKEQLASTGAMKWNDAIYGASWASATTGSPGAIVNATALVSITGASVALDPNYLGSDLSKVSYVGLRGTTAAGIGGGIFRLIDSAAGSLSGSAVNSVALNTAGDKLVAGGAGVNTVYRLASPATAVVPASANTPNKGPGFAFSTSTLVVARYAGTSVVAGTATPGSGGNDESAFSVSSDDGKTFTDVALVDTTFAPTGFATAADGSKLYITSYNTVSSALSVWKKTTAFARVLTQKDTTANVSFLVRVAPENSDVVYVAEKLGTGISGLWYSNDGGATTWTFWPGNMPIAAQDMDVESASVVWVVSNAGMVVKSTDAGFTWIVSKDLAFTGVAADSAMIDVLSANSVVVGGGAGQVAYTADGGTTWVTNLAAGAGPAKVTADKLTTGGNIYAASGNSVYRYTIGTSVIFGAIKSATAGGGVMLGNAYGIALSSGALYVVADNGVNSYLYRSLSPAAVVVGWNGGVAGPAAATETTSTGTVYQLQFINTPRDLFVTVGSDKNPKLWALSLGARKAVESFTDTLALAGPTLTGPANGTTIQINAQTGKAVAVAFTWSAIVAGPVTYDIDVALDTAFLQIINPTVCTAATNLKLIGPDDVAFQPDQTYYWRVRVDPSGPLDSPYSATGNFKIGSLSPLKLVTPASGASDVSVTPDYSWTAVTGATNYEIFVSDDPTFAVITFSANSDKPVYSSTEALAYSTTYYWRVRASAPATAVTPFVYGIFTTEAKPTTTQPPVTVTQQGPTTITFTVPPSPQVIPNYLLWIIIGIGAVLVIALIVLILRGRRPA